MAAKFAKLSRFPNSPIFRIRFPAFPISLFSTFISILFVILCDRCALGVRKLPSVFGRYLL